jgi:uncharacterized membrane protein YdbT with pleckstrin-like domain
VLGIVGIGIYLFIRDVVKMETIRWAVTDRRIVYKKGFFRRVTAEIAVENVETVKVRQSFLGKILGYGEIMITGKGESKLILPPTQGPIAFRRVLETARTGMVQAPAEIGAEVALRTERALRGRA